MLHLAAQAGVRYSLVNPAAYTHSNLVGFANVVEACRRHDVGHLVYASTSSVYGGNRKLPFSEGDAVDHPVSFYAATKKANEAMAHSYSHLFGLPTTGLRYFTVYGPWGRPDMSPMLFAARSSTGRPIDVFNHGDMSRDFTYVDDIVEGTLRVLDQPATPDPSFDPTRPMPRPAPRPGASTTSATTASVNLLTYIETLERALGRIDREDLEADAGRRRAGHVRGHRAAAAPRWGSRRRRRWTVGLERFAAWFRGYRERRG